jgi:hypothetical protein
VRPYRRGGVSRLRSAKRRAGDGLPFGEQLKAALGEALADARGEAPLPVAAVIVKKPRRASKRLKRLVIEAYRP